MIDPRLPSWAQNVSRETFLQLERYVALLLKWNPKINLIGPATEGDIWSRHIADSLQLISIIPSSITRMADFGSGGGLPGLVIAICRPEIQIHLVEQDQRKSAFIREASAQLGLKNTIIHAVDITTLDEKFELITARALASLEKLFALAYPLLAPPAFCLFPKGENYVNEIADAEKIWGFKYQLFNSKTHEKSSIISVSELFKKD